MCGEDTPDHIFIDGGSEGSVDLLRDSGATEPWIALLQWDDSLDEFLRRTLGTSLSLDSR